MRVFNTAIIILSGYFIVIAFGISAPSAYNAIITIPINTYQSILDDAFMVSKQRQNPTFYNPEINDKKGVTINNTDLSYTGLTFFANAEHDSDALLIDQDGKIVHKWSVSPHDIFENEQNVPEDFFRTPRAFLDTQTGDVYAIVRVVHRTPNGLGLVKMDKDSKVLWVHEGYIHHDVAIDQNKNRLYTLGQTILYAPHPNFPNIHPPFMDEEIRVLNPDTGEEIKRISFLNLFEKSGKSEILSKISHMPQDPGLASGDVFHSNTVELVPAEAVGKAPMLKEGHLLVSFRNLDLLIMVDPEDEIITWASYGPWKGQHDPEIQPDGTLLLFDNQGELSLKGGISRLLHIDLNTLGILWEYSGTKEQPMSSPYASSIHVLPNSNILVSESYTSRMLEVTPDKEVVWEYWSPNRKDIGDVKFIPNIFSGMRYAYDDIKFLEE